MKTLYYTATSLDGFLATPDDDVSWLDTRPQPTTDTWTPFITNVGAICTGAATYRFLLRHVEKGHPWPHEQPMWVFTNHDLPIPKGADVRLVRGDVGPVHEAMRKAAGDKDVWIVGGGGLAAQFLAAGLLDELVITIASCTLGKGKPLLPIRGELRLLGARALGEGFAELRYAPARA
ncbi:MAG TPA: dihydrofolate reductase family protein [Candidatus Thermoplasmatota archaeon]|nr:dihydrofolate reductase family protein [Candidatus Thermoplasmatota archaeon]